MPKRVKPSGDDSLEDFYVPTGLDPDYDAAAYFKRADQSDVGLTRTTSPHESSSEDEHVKPSHRKTDQTGGRAKWDAAAEAMGRTCLDAVKAGGNRGNEKKKLARWLVNENYHEKWRIDKSALPEVYILFSR